MWNNREFSSPALFWPQAARDWFGEAIERPACGATRDGVGRALGALAR